MKIVMCIIITLFLIGCVVTPANFLFGRNLKNYVEPIGVESATVKFSWDRKFESEKGVPYRGEPIICLNSEPQKVITNIVKGGKEISVKIEAGKEIMLTSVIKFGGGVSKVCAPFLSFTPEANKTYFFVNEVIGGKGASAMWTGVAFQYCEVSIFEVNGGSFIKLESNKVKKISCGNK